MSDDFDDEKPQKPKKFAEVHLTVWDDAELEIDCIRFKPRESGRGAPRKIIIEDKKEWMDDVDEQVMSRYGILKFIKEELDLADTKPSIPGKEDDDNDFDIDEVE